MNSTTKIRSYKGKKNNNTTHPSSPESYSVYKNGKSHIGSRTVANEQMDKTPLTGELKKIFTQQDPDSKFINNMKFDELYDYVNKKHHGNIGNNGYFLKESLEKLCKINERDHPKLFEIRNLFINSLGEVTFLCKNKKNIRYYFEHLILASKK